MATASTIEKTPIAAIAITAATAIIDRKLAIVIMANKGRLIAPAIAITTSGPARRMTGAMATKIVGNSSRSAGTSTTTGITTSSRLPTGMTIAERGTVMGSAGITAMDILHVNIPNMNILDMGMMVTEIAPIAAIVPVRRATATITLMTSDLAATPRATPSANRNAISHNG